MLFLRSDAFSGTLIIIEGIHMFANSFALKLSRQDLLNSMLACHPLPLGLRLSLASELTGRGKTDSSAST